MVKSPYTYLIYSILSLVLFLWGCYILFVRQTRQGWLSLFILSLPLILSIVLLIVFFVKKKKMSDHGIYTNDVKAK